MAVELVHIGFGNIIALNRVLAILAPDSAPVKRLVQETRDRNSLIDATHGRKTKAVIVLDNGQLALAAILPDTIATRAEQLTHSAESPSSAPGSLPSAQEEEDR